MEYEPMSWVQKLSGGGGGDGDGDAGPSRKKHAGLTILAVVIGGGLVLFLTMRRRPGAQQATSQGAVTDPRLSTVQPVDQYGQMLQGADAQLGNIAQGLSVQYQAFMDAQGKQWTALLDQLKAQAPAPAPAQPLTWQSGHNVAQNLDPSLEPWSSAPYSWLVKDPSGVHYGQSTYTAPNSWQWAKAPAELVKAEQAAQGTIDPKTWLATHGYGVGGAARPGLAGDPMIWAGYQGLDNGGHGLGWHFARDASEPAQSPAPMLTAAAPVRYLGPPVRRDEGEGQVGPDDQQDDGRWVNRLAAASA
jgi:hypothetical protein